MRRRKIDLEMMKEDVSLYLLRNNNDPHEAWNNFIKDNLMNRSAMPYYIKGIKDFIKVSKDIQIKLELEEKEQLEKQQYKELKTSVIDSIKSLKKEESNTVWKVYKDKVSNSEKLVLADLVNMIFYQEYWINNEHINLCTKYKLI